MSKSDVIEVEGKVVEASFRTPCSKWSWRTVTRCSAISAVNYA